MLLCYLLPGTGRVPWFSILLSFTLFASIPVQARQKINALPQIIPRSPDATSTENRIRTPASESTGIPDVNIQLADLKVGSFALPINIVYHKNGLKVDEVPSCVGDGWSLEYGGIISFQQNGLHDFRAGGLFSAGLTSTSLTTLKSFLRGQLSTPEQWTYFEQIINGTADAEFDQYLYRFMGKSGAFYYDTLMNAVTVPETNLKIFRQANEIRILDTENNNYYFGATEQSSSFDSATTGFRPSFNDISTYYLSRIVTGENRTILFRYKSYSYSTRRSKAVVQVTPGGSTFACSLGDGAYFYRQKEQITCLLPDSIIFDQGLVKFSISTAPREDIKTIQSTAMVPYITGFSVFAANKKIREFSFVQNYFDTNKRLRLARIQQLNGAAPDKIWQFHYYHENEAFPAFFSSDQDHWGYYNAHHADNINSNSNPGQTPGLIPTITVGGTTTNGAIRDASWPAMSYGSLTRIDYPTGGHTTMEFESNTALVSTTSIVDGYRAAFALNISGQSAIQPAETFVSNGNDLTLSYSTTCNWGVRFKIVNNSDNSVPYDVELSNNLNSDPTQPWTSSGTISGTYFPPGSYTVSAVIDNSGTINGGISIHLTQKEPQTVTSNVLLGGMRIKTMTVSDGTSGNDMVTNYSYTTPGGSQTAVLYSVPTYVQQIRNDLIANVGYWGTSGFTDYTFGSNGCPGGYIVSPGTLRPMASVQGSIIGYSLVTVSKPGNGSSVYSYYTVDQGFPTTLNPGFAVTTATGNCESTIHGYPSAPLPFVSKRGELQSESHYDNTGNLLKTISYYSQFNLSPVLPTPAFIVQSSLFAGSTRWLGAFYNQSTVRKTSMQIVENDFGTSGGILSKTTTITYGSAFHNQPTSTVTTTSNGDTLTTRTSYVSDLRLASCDAISDGSTEYNNACATCTSTYNTARINCGSNTSCLTTAYESYLQCNTNARIAYVDSRNANYMGTNNAFDACHLSAENNADPLLKPFLTLQDVAINTPMESSEWRNSNLTHATFTSYALMGSPTLFPYPAKTRTLNLSATSASFSPVAISGSSVGVDGRYTDEASYRFQAGNAVQVIAHDGVPTCYVWDYLNQKPIAKVINATSDQVAYTSFEADGTGGWTPGGGSVNTLAAITGRNSYNLAGSISKAGLNSGTMYFVSYWVQGNALSITGTISGYPQKGKTVTISNTSWTLYIHKVTGRSTITVSGSATIDELRLYPANAQMTTYTYDPLAGMTTQTDVANRVTYYEYDGLQRLKRVRDQDYNILKSLEYQYQATVGCGSGCYILPLRNFAGNAPLSYPVGVFNVNGKPVGNAASPDDYVAKWNSDAADAQIGTLAKGGDSVHFNLTANAGQIVPSAITGCRYFQYDLPWHTLDCVIFYNGDYVDWGDGTGMRLGSRGTDLPAVIPPGTVNIFNPYTQTWTFTHNYPNDSLKTITFYHSDDFKATDIPTYQSISGQPHLQNLRGNMPQHTTGIGSTSYQQASALTVAGIANWNSITSCTSFLALAGDLVTPNEHMNYAQDFMANNRGLNTIQTTATAIGPAYFQAGYRDTTFKLSRLKSDWNTWFTELQDIEISDDHWNREDLSALTKLKTFILVATNTNHSNDPSNNFILAIPGPVLDSILIQIDRGAGQSVSNGSIYLEAGPGTTRTHASDLAKQHLIDKGWYVYVPDPAN